MKTIRSKLVSIFITDTLATMMLVLLLFNIAISASFDRIARAELKNTFSTMNILIEKQLTDTLFTGADVGDDSALSALGSALTASRLSGETEFFIFDGAFNLLFPTDIEQTGLTEVRLSYIRSLDFTSGSTAVNKAPTGDYYVAGVPFDKIKGFPLYIVFVAGTEETQALIQRVDFLLAAVMLICAIAGVLFARTAANNISKPIRQTCEYAARIGCGDFTAVPTEASTAEIHQLRESIDDMSSRLRAADQAQKQFLQNASHELRTPLMSIQGYAEAIEAGIGFEPREAAAVIKAESRRLTVLVEELLTLSRMESYLFDSKAETLEINDIISEYVYRLEGAAFREKKKIVWQPAEWSVYVVADEQLMSQAVNNVISNCLRYAVSQVSISVTCEDGEAVLSIGDDGPGIGEDELPHIFDRFYKGKKGAYGLGLAIAEKAVTLMGGSIAAGNSEVGAIFRLRFKAVKKEAN